MSVYAQGMNQFVVYSQYKFFPFGLRPNYPQGGRKNCACLVVSGIEKNENTEAAFVRYSGGVTDRDVLLGSVLLVVINILDTYVWRDVSLVGFILLL
jgi:hypothetical protein